MNKTKLHGQLISKLDAIHLVKSVLFITGGRQIVYDFDGYRLEDKDGNRIMNIETLKANEYVYLYN